ncbi:uncharacterized protein Z518_09196 [Rhinocladiella mackenziei CBS 650.93]|uniref:Uncharacterized protein n=1 Tax=Rhinocladiella mackenziei CBS 650.93 TaxID=1442369 RepID=A0A0D2IY30_9EURO|nr:uncharacterized protein Z518_09196 [Rhinocladiella mackenziei CBS 650.93]KIX01470.1 hypothetical protein Z518_09196 [Rhinocladiella mackenziei CBS 650.93]
MAPKTPSYARQTRSSNLKSRNPSNTPGQIEETVTNETSNIFSTPISNKDSLRKQTVKNATVRDVDFEETQLIPRGVEMLHSHQNIVIGAHAYFDSDTPPDQPNHANSTYPSFIQPLQEELNGT